MFEIYKVSSGNQFARPCVRVCVYLSACPLKDYPQVGNAQSLLSEYSPRSPFPFPSPFQLIASLGKLLNCSNNIATDIDMCHLICIILARARPGTWVALTLTCSRWCPAQKPNWHRAGQGKQAGEQASDFWAGPPRRARCEPLKLHCRPHPASLSVCLYFCKFIDNWQFEMATTTTTTLQTKQTKARRVSPSCPVSRLSWGNF